MATFSDCSSCLSGNHSGHVYHWGKRPEGVIDGDFCPCTGDCKDRHLALMRDFMGEMGDLFGRPPTAYDVLEMLKQQEVITTDPKRKLCCGIERDANGFCINRPYHPIYVEYE